MQLGGSVKTSNMSTIHEFGGLWGGGLKVLKFYFKDTLPPPKMFRGKFFGKWYFRRKL